MTDVNLPAVLPNTTPALDALTTALDVPRNVLAGADEIDNAWQGLPRLLKRIPPALRDESLARLCVAVSVGLFDSGINYIWNASILELRCKIRRFGLNVVAQVVGKQFDEDALLDLKDCELLSLSLKLNLVTEEGFFFLDQCRDIRNNFSAAHPSVGNLDDTELLNFVSRCAKYALGDETNPIGVDIQAFISALKSGRFTDDQKSQWNNRLRQTHDAQRELLFGTLHGIYCDPASSQDTRFNALAICLDFVNSFSPKTQSELIDRHSEYSAKGDTQRHTASQQFFEKLGILELLTEAERHSLITSACQRLYNVHQGFDNFYNEPPFAERLCRIAQQGAMPNTAKNAYVTTVVTCAVGNPYGVSNAAVPYYREMIQNFTPMEIDIMLALPKSKTVVGERIRRGGRCKPAFRSLVTLLDERAVPVSKKTVYQKWLEGSDCSA